MRDNIYNPDKWLLIKTESPEGKVDYRIFGSWSGSYLYGDSWRLSSSIESVGYNPENDTYTVDNKSGSTYILSKKITGTTAYNAAVLGSMKKHAENIGFQMDAVNKIPEHLVYKEK